MPDDFDNQDLSEADSPLDDFITGAEDGHTESLAERIEHAAFQAELETGVRETSVAEVKSHIAVRIVRIFVGFLVVIIGFALLPLPGPGWVVIAGGFVILSKDFAWADRTVRLIRRRVPGVPEDGRIPTRSWIMIVVVTVGALVIAFFFGDAIRSVIGDAWSRVVDIF